MSASKDRKQAMLTDGVEFKPVYRECPECGCDLQKWHDSFVDQVSTYQAKNCSSNAERTLEAGAKKSLAHRLFNNCVAWVIFPFTTAKKTPPREIKSAEFVGSFGSSPPAVERNTIVQITMSTLYQTSS